MIERQGVIQTGSIYILLGYPVIIDDSLCGLGLDAVCLTKCQLRRTLGLWLGLRLRLLLLSELYSLVFGVALLVRKLCLRLRCTSKCRCRGNGISVRILSVRESRPRACTIRPARWNRVDFRLCRLATLSLASRSTVVPGTTTMIQAFVCSTSKHRKPNGTMLT